MRAALRDVIANLRPSDHAQIEEFLDHNELGVAWEWLVEALALAQAPISYPTKERLERAAALMALDLDQQPNWQQLKISPD